MSRRKSSPKLVPQGPLDQFERSTAVCSQGDRRHDLGGDFRPLPLIGCTGRESGHDVDDVVDLAALLVALAALHRRDFLALETREQAAHPNADPHRISPPLSTGSHAQIVSRARHSGNRTAH